MMNIFKKDNFIHLFKEKYQKYYLFIFSFLEAIIFPIPPDVFLIISIIQNKTKAIYYIFICSIGSVLGGSVGYYLGKYFWYNGSEYSRLANIFFDIIPGFNQFAFQNIQNEFLNYGFLIIFTAGFTPIPYKIFTIISGIVDIPFTLFLIGSILSRTLRFLILGLIVKKYGTIIKNNIYKYFNILSIIIVLIIIILYIFIR